MPFLSQSTPRESPTFATVSSLSDRRATRHVVPETDGGGKETVEDQRKNEMEQEKGGGERSCIIMNFL